MPALLRERGNAQRAHGPGEEWGAPSPARGEEGEAARGRAGPRGAVPGAWRGRGPGGLEVRFQTAASSVQTGARALRVRNGSAWLLWGATRYRTLLRLRARRSLQVTNSPPTSLFRCPAAGERWEGWEEGAGS